MKSHTFQRRWVVAFLPVAVALCVMPAAQAQNGDDAVGGPVFLILSLEEAFDTADASEDGSGTVFVEIGKLIANQAIYDTRFETSDVSVKLPKNIQWKKLDEFPFTVLGSFKAPKASVHLTSSHDGDVPQKVQEAFFLVSPELTEEFESQFPTTVEIAQFIYDRAVEIAGEKDPDGNYIMPAPPPDPTLWQPTDPPSSMAEWLDFNFADSDHLGDPRGGKLTPQMILDNVFRTEETIDTSGDVYVEGEGDLFPHQPSAGDRLFGFVLSIEKKGKKAGHVTTDTVLDVEIDVKPGNSDNVIEKSDNGVVWVAILTTVVTTTHTDSDGNFIKVVAFDAANEMDGSWESVELGPGSASPKDYKIEDADHDGHDDITLKFNVNDIGLSSATKEITLTGETDAYSPMKIIGTDSVTIKK
jgi:hypothetical protein